jgi:hypothetical protein
VLSWVAVSITGGRREIDGGSVEEHGVQGVCGVGGASRMAQVDGVMGDAFRVGR